MVVALLLLCAAVLVVWRAWFVALGPAWVPRAGSWAIAIVFALRAVGDFRYVGFFKRARDTVFARHDTFVYSPLCLALAVLAVWLALGP